MVTDAASLGLALFADAVARRPPSRARRTATAAPRCWRRSSTRSRCSPWSPPSRSRRSAGSSRPRRSPADGRGHRARRARRQPRWPRGCCRARRDRSTRAARCCTCMGDLLGSLAAIVAGGVIVATGWTPIDPILSLAVALLILRSTWQLLEAVDRRADGAACRRTSTSTPSAGRWPRCRACTDVHDLHVWHMTSEGVALSAHLSIARGDDWLATLAQREADARDGLRHPPRDAAADLAACRRPRVTTRDGIPARRSRGCTTRRDDAGRPCAGATSSQPLRPLEAVVEVGVGDRPSRRATSG